MLAVISILTFALTGQFAGELPETMPYILLLDDDRRVHGFIDRPDWERDQSVAVRIDEPWLNPSGRARIETVLRSKIRDYSRETASLWRRRHLEGWQSQGYVNIGTDNRFYFIKAEEVELAQRAKALAEIKSLPTMAETVPVSVAEEITAADSLPAQGFLQLWGLHLAIAVAAVGLMGIIAWGMLLR